MENLRIKSESVKPALGPTICWVVPIGFVITIITFFIAVGIGTRIYGVFGYASPPGYVSVTVYLFFSIILSLFIGFVAFPLLVVVIPKIRDLIRKAED